MMLKKTGILSLFIAAILTHVSAPVAAQSIVDRSHQQTIINGNGYRIHQDLHLLYIEPSSRFVDIDFGNYNRNWTTGQNRSFVQKRDRAFDRYRDRHSVRLNYRDRHPRSSSRHFRPRLYH